MILEVEEGGMTVSNKEQIKESFAKNMEELLGKSEPILTFHVQALYQSNPNLDDLQLPFTMKEVESAVKQLANNKVSGPDGLPNKFIKTYWMELKSEIFQIMLQFHDNCLNLSQFNEANIIMIPKTDAPRTTSDFCPTSVINLISKLITKVLSNRLRSKLPALISSRETTFVHGRQISENFVATRETLHHIAHTGKSAVFIKIDFKKAFDSLEWEFLIRVMRARGFPERWIFWMQAIWLTSSSRVCINGETSRSFVHKRDLCQGDPLSSMLFNVAVDVFQRMAQITSSILETPLSNKISESLLAF